MAIHFLNNSAMWAEHRREWKRKEREKAQLAEEFRKAEELLRALPEQNKEPS